MCATQTIPTTTTHTGFLADFRGQMSWGRFCSAASLAVAVVQEFRGKNIADIALFLSIATGTYTASKITEMITHKTTIQQEGSDAQS